jgi:hypothetical protein
LRKAPWLLKSKVSGNRRSLDYHGERFNRILQKMGFDEIAKWR